MEVPRLFPGIVADLVRLVGRAFYRDEYVMVLDALTEGPICNDNLGVVFGIAERQTRLILNDLMGQQLVSSEEVTEERQGKPKRGELDTDALKLKAMQVDQGLAGSASAAFSVEESEEEDESESDDAASGSVPEAKRFRRGVALTMEERHRFASGVAEDSKSGRRHMRVTKRIWFINPCYFVDVVRFRVFCLERFLTTLTHKDVKTLCRCPRCSDYVCDMQNALVAAQKLMLDARAAAPARGVSSASQPGPKLSDYMLCPGCNTRLEVMPPTQPVADMASRVLKRFVQFKSESGLEKLLDKLKDVELGANRPSEMLRNKEITMFPPDPATSSDIAILLHANGPLSNDSGDKTGPVRLYQLVTSASASDASASEAPAAPVVPVARQSETGPAQVSASIVPIHLQHSSITGEQSRVLGFLKVADKDDKLGKFDAVDQSAVQQTKIASRISDDTAAALRTLLSHTEDTTDEGGMSAASAVVVEDEPDFVADPDMERALWNALFEMATAELGVSSGSADGTAAGAAGMAATPALPPSKEEEEEEEEEDWEDV